ncbi:hypothetical protein SAMN02745174_00499 [Cetobacterium ceti]|uniref:DUF1292 domain-containing protein n=1 Tax=Cetobacterium ceti TaxID=180163 RepID=A0A1T4KME1_9FUSO|nr:hypothetical protein [Cetobacterium ceti]SJZ43560.1 hypothetical protein SAMN02745174_00499 [Cetobacterium ceti]
MYSQGETFYYEIDDEEYELHVLENFTMRDREYIIGEDYDGNKQVFLYDEDSDDLIHIDDKGEALEILDYWKDEYMMIDDIGDWDEDSYYDREDEYDNDDYYGNEYDGYDDEEDYY